MSQDTCPAVAGSMCMTSMDRPRATTHKDKPPLSRFEHCRAERFVAKVHFSVKKQVISNWSYEPPWPKFVDSANSHAQPELSI
jgi:hypothetical protein